MMKKLAVVLFALAFGAVAYTPTSSACPGMDKSVETEDKQEKKDESPKTADKAKSKDTKKKTKKAKKGKKAPKKEVGTKVSKK